MSLTRRAASAAIAAVALFALPPLAGAHGYKLGDLEIGHPWTRATPPSARVGAGYLKITNNGSQTERLVSATFDGSAAVEAHEMSNDNGVMKMRELAQGIAIKPGETIELKPGGSHLMFVGLKAGLVEQQRIKGALVFEKAGRVEVEFVVDAIGAKGEAHDHAGHGAKAP